ncbi:MAG: beta-ketoacyl-ACP synthase III [Candidatus Marinimicrobia bacterium]|jgi:3-oxoacyl-[acyl-carrier-protein] synthase-3|nr:beta-ketoacyl-ACP synthase III [Candidatus Neomarinimicrobiota bacterium]
MNKAKIAGIGYSVPDRIVTNTELEKYMDTTDEWIQTRSGIKERRWVESGTGTSDLAIDASKKAIQMADIDPQSIDMVIVGSLTSDYFFPGVSAQVQDALDLSPIGAFDVKAACSAFIYSLSIGDQFIQSGKYKTILVIGAEVQSTALDMSDKGRHIAVLFADGAGAVILKKHEGDSGILSTHLHCEGKFLKELWCEGPASRENPRLSVEMLNEGRHFPYMNGREVFRNAVKRFPEVILEALDENGLSIDDISLVIPHQANERITTTVRKKLGIEKSKVFSNIHKFGNTTGASIPIALCDAYEQGKISEKDIIILAAFGAGFTWASAAIRW